MKGCTRAKPSQHPEFDFIMTLLALPWTDTHIMFATNARRYDPGSDGGHEMCVSAWLINRNMPFHDYLLSHIFLDDNTMMALYPSKLFLTTSIFLKNHNSVIVFLYQMYFFNLAISQKLKESWTISVLVVTFNLTPKWGDLFLNFQFTNSCFQEPLFSFLFLF